MYRAGTVGSTEPPSRPGINSVMLVTTRLAPSNSRKPRSPIGVSPPSSAAGAASAVSANAPRHGVIRARAKRTLLPATTTMLHDSAISGRTR